MINERVQRVSEATATLINEGHLVFSPIVFSHPIANMVNFSAVHDEHTDFSPGNTWLDYDLAMIDKADELWVLCIDGWKESVGVTAEIKHATDTGKPIKYIYEQ